jgi:hypothetical protein
MGGSASGARGVSPDPETGAWRGGRVALVGVSLLQQLAQWAAATAFLACLGCFIAAALGIQFSASALMPGDAAFALARTMAILGGAGVIVAGLSSTLYFWLIGVASDRAAVMVGTGMVAAALVFVGMLGMLHARGHTAHR